MTPSDGSMEEKWANAEVQKTMSIGRFFTLALSRFEETRQTTE
jgi:hypothetical protein